MRFDKTLMHISNENSEIPFRENFFKAVTPNNLGASFFFKRVFSVKIFIEINRFWNHDSWCITLDGLFWKITDIIFS